MRPEVAIGIDPGPRPGMVECREWERQEGRWPAWLPGKIEIISVVGEPLTVQAKWYMAVAAATGLMSKLVRNRLPPQHTLLVAIEDPVMLNPYPDLADTIKQAGAFEYRALRWADQVTLIAADKVRRVLFGKKCPKCSGKGTRGRAVSASQREGDDALGSWVGRGGKVYRCCLKCDGYSVWPPGSRGALPKHPRGKATGAWWDRQVDELLLELYGGQAAVGGQKCSKCKGGGRWGRGKLWLVGSENIGYSIKHNHQMYRPCPTCDGKGENPRGPLYPVMASGKKGELQHHRAALATVVAAYNRLEES